MLLKSLVLGILFGIGVFALKSGLGLAAALSRRRRRQRLFGLLLFALLWALVFAGVALSLPRLDPLRHLAAIQSFMRSGMLIHLLLAALMLVWGLLLLRRGQAASTATSRGWLLLVLPCPVCVTVIFLSAAFFQARFPAQGATLLPGLYLAFMLISLTAAVIGSRRLEAAASPEAFLGGIMILLATYFFLSVTIMPQFADLDKIYRLAGCPDARSPVDPSQIHPMLALIALAFGAGFTLTWKRTGLRRSHHD